MMPGLDGSTALDLYLSNYEQGTRLYQCLSAPAHQPTSVVEQNWSEIPGSAAADDLSNRPDVFTSPAAEELARHASSLLYQVMHNTMRKAIRALGACGYDRD